MSATLADDSLLTTRMGVDAECVTQPIIPSSASDLGDRIILSPTESLPVAELEKVKDLIQGWGNSVNVVVIVPSRFRGEQWRPYTNEIHDKKTIEDVINRLKTGHVGLVVLIGRYDGVDLPDDACRVLVLDGIPAGYSPQERVKGSALGGTQEMNSHQVQRIEQGMGRGIRSTDDYCAVLLLDPRLVEKLYSASSQMQLSPATRAQYELSRKFAESSNASSLQFFDDAIREFLERDTEWVNASKEALKHTVYGSPNQVPPIAIAEHKAFKLALTRQFEEAKTALMENLTDIEDARYRGWIKQRAASYLHQVNSLDARKIQESARGDNNYLLRIPNDSRPPRLKPAKNQAIAAAEFLRDRYATAHLLQLGVESLLRDLTPSSERGTSNSFEAAIKELGLFLGFTSLRPEKEDPKGGGPDNLWVTTDNNFWIIEAKSEAIAKEVRREYLKQLTNSTDWCIKHYPGNYKCLPILIHPSRHPKSDAIARESARVMTFDKLGKLRDAVRRFSRAIQIESGYRDFKTVESNLIEYNLDSNSFINQWTQTFKEPGSYKESR